MLIYFKVFKIIKPVGSLGGIESTITCPAETSHAKVSREKRIKYGISDGLLRFSVGIEDYQDLEDDFESGFLEKYEEVKLDILAFGAHPDDVELGCGGTLAKEMSNGKKVGIIDLTAGELGTRGSAEIRTLEAEQSFKNFRFKNT